MTAAQGEYGAALSSEATLARLRTALQDAADPQHAAFHRTYHKSELEFYGLRTPQLQTIWRELWPARQAPSRSMALELQAELWGSGMYEETLSAIHLLSLVVKQLTTADLPLLHQHTRNCSGWGQLDFLALRVLGPLALCHERSIYEPVFDWLEDGWLWTRRAAILIHLIPGRSRRLAAEFAWPSLAARLHEREFFIRKAIGWTLREIGKHYPSEVAAFARQYRESMAALTLREGTRNLPEALRAEFVKNGA